MSEHHFLTVSDSFDHDFGQSNDLTTSDSGHDTASSLLDYQGMSTYDGSNDFLDFHDPLKYAYKHQFQPLTLDLGNTHFVNPHYVDGYLRSDGTFVEGYYRDGDGNTAIDRSAEAGGGYLRSDPDGDPFNNLK